MQVRGDLTTRLRDFARERDWEQFHSPKNLVMALVGEVGELTAEFQWLSADESKTVLKDSEMGSRVRAELGDVMIYLTRLADVLGVDLIDEAHNKLDNSEKRYDPATHRGSARKAPPLP